MNIPNTNAKIVHHENDQITEIELEETSSGGILELKKAIVKSKKENIPLAISGRNPKHTSEMIKLAINTSDKNTLKGLTVLYIGERKYYKLISEISNQFRVNLLFEPTPETSPYTE